VGRWQLVAEIMDWQERLAKLEHQAQSGDAAARAERSGYSSEAH
jgi:hypothetical protein